MGLFSAKNKPEAQLPRRQDRRGAETSVIGGRIAVKGKISGSGSLIVMGNLEGEIDLDGELVVSPPAKLRGQVRAKAIAVAGAIEGQIAAEEKIHLEKNAVFSGELHTGRISIAEGAVLNASVVMNQEAVRKKA